jgi:hypothetical protein
MTLWFGPFVELEPAHGYFHLCPRCYRECVEPHMEDVQGKLAHLHPRVAAYLEREREDAEGPDDAEGADAPDEGAADEEAAASGE